MTATHRWLAGLAAALVVGYLAGYCTRRDVSDRQLQRNAVAVAKAETLLVERKAETDTVRVLVRQGIDRWRVDTLWRGDTVTIRDTVRVLVPQPTLFAMDSTIRACAQLDTAITRERTACETVQQRLRERIELLERKPLRSRIGCQAGYGAVYARGEVRHGPGVSCGLTLWP